MNIYLVKYQKYKSKLVSNDTISWLNNLNINKIRAIDDEIYEKLCDVMLAIDDNILLINYKKVLRLISLLVQQSILTIINIDILYENPNINYDEGDIISLIKIYSTTMYNDIKKSIYLTYKYKLHKSVFQYMFNYLFTIEDYDTIRLLYTNYHNILEHAKKVKEIKYTFLSWDKYTDIIVKDLFEHSRLIINDSVLIDISDQRIEYFEKLPIPKTSTMLLDDNTYKKIFNMIIENKQSVHSDIIIDYVKTIPLHSIPSNKSYPPILSIMPDINIFESVIEKLLYIDVDIVARYLNKTIQNYNTDCLKCDICPYCRNKFSKSILSELEKRVIFVAMDNQYSQNIFNKQTLSQSSLTNITNIWEQFKTLISRNRHDVVLDVANISYYDEINYNNVVSYIRYNIYSKKILFIVPEGDMNVKGKNINNKKRIKSIIDEHKRNPNFTVVIVPYNVNDDWYWLYASLYQNIPIITNDECNGNECNFGFKSEVNDWLQYYKMSSLDNKHTIPLSKFHYDESYIHIINGNELFCLS